MKKLLFDPDYDTPDDGDTEPEVRFGIADFKCNVCGKVVQRDLGWKYWTKSYCETTGKNARLYRISAPSKI